MPRRVPATVPAPKGDQKLQVLIDSGQSDLIFDPLSTPPGRSPEVVFVLVQRHQEAVEPIHGLLVGGGPGYPLDLAIQFVPTIDLVLKEARYSPSTSRSSATSSSFLSRERSQ